MIMPPMSQHRPRLLIWAAGLFSPALILFLSANVANVGNFAFNLIFSRLLTPAEFADLTFLLTVKLAILSVLGAVQMAVSQQVAAGTLTPTQVMGALGKRAWLIGSVAAIPLAAAVFIGIPLVRALAVLALAFPVVGPLSLWRGISLGQLDMARSVATFQIEMVMRLGLALLFWMLGWGLPGLALALFLSLIAAWMPLAIGPRCLSVGSHIQTQGVAKLIAVAALPFAGLQLGQVLLLDGDIFVAKAMLSDAQTGVMAALGLLQRVQFFACFGLAMALLPSILVAVRNGKPLGRVFLPVGVLYLGVNVPLLAGAFWVPDIFLNVLVGGAYDMGIPFVPWVCISAALFTLTYLLVTLMIALSDRRGLWVLLAFIVIQLSLQMGITYAFSGQGLAALIYITVACQVFLGAVIIGLVLKLKKPPLTLGDAVN